MKVLIIEDELLASRALARSINRLEPDITIVGAITSVEEGIEWFKNRGEADLIFSDIQLADGLSFDIFKSVNTDIPVVFTTAYSDYTLQAFKMNSIDYLLKPFEEEDLQGALTKYSRLKNRFEVNAPQLTQDIIDSLIETTKKKSNYREKFLVTVGDQYVKVDVDEIAFFYAEGNTVYLVKKNNSKVIVDYSLELLSKCLNPKNFFRINRQLILRDECIKRIHKYFNSRLKLEIAPEFDSEVLVTRSRANEFLNWLDN